MRRLPFWRSRFSKAVEEIRRTPMDWTQQHDCALMLVSGAVEAITGEDIGAPYRGRYSSPEEALQMLRDEGYADLGELVAELLPEISEGPSMARVGDVVLITTDDAFGYSLGVVNGERVIVMRPEGIGTIELLEATRAFRVG